MQPPSCRRREPCCSFWLDAVVAPSRAAAEQSARSLVVAPLTLPFMPQHLLLPHHPSQLQAQLVEVGGLGGRCARLWHAAGGPGPGLAPAGRRRQGGVGGHRTLRADGGAPPLQETLTGCPSHVIPAQHRCPERLIRTLHLGLPPACLSVCRTLTCPTSSAWRCAPSTSARTGG